MGKRILLEARLVGAKDVDGRMVLVTVKDYFKVEHEFWYLASKMRRPRGKKGR